MPLAQIHDFWYISFQNTFIPNSYSKCLQWWALGNSGPILNIIKPKILFKDAYVAVAGTPGHGSVHVVEQVVYITLNIILDMKGINLIIIQLTHFFKNELVLLDYFSLCSIYFSRALCVFSKKNLSTDKLWVVQL